jgi:hypothetical protein
MIRLRFTPPVGDADWDSWLEEAHREVTAMLAAMGLLDDAHLAMMAMPAASGGKPSIKQALYKRQRDRLLKVTHGKCAYCELPLAAGQRKGDVEHYRPKGGARGRDGKIVKIRRDGGLISHPGYFWLAYEYTNLLPCCSACNRRAFDTASGTQTGKADIFPTLDGRWASRPEEVTSELPALLNPWIDDPAEHMIFDPDTGLVIGKTERGKVTVWLLGLNRDGLPEERLAACRNVRRTFQVVVGDTVGAGAQPADRSYLKSVREGAAPFSAICREELRRRRQEVYDLLSKIDD